MDRIYLVVGVYLVVKEHSVNKIYLVDEMNFVIRDFLP